MGRNVWKFVGGFVALLILGLVAFYLLQYYQYRQNPQFKAQKQFEELERRYAEDTYGGFTPEETLQLFIEALKKEDIELASKYFVIDEQEKWKAELAEATTQDGLEMMISEAQNLKLDKNDGERAFFIIVSDKNIVEVQVILGKSSNDRWKILEL